MKTVFFAVFLGMGLIWTGFSHSQQTQSGHDGKIDEMVSKIRDMLYRNKPLISDDFDAFFNDDFLKGSKNPLAEIEQMEKKITSLFESERENFYRTYNKWATERFNLEELNYGFETTKNKVILSFQVPELDKKSLDIKMARNTVKLAYQAKEYHETTDGTAALPPHVSEAMPTTEKGNIAKEALNRKHLKIVSIPPEADPQKYTIKTEDNTIKIAFDKIK